MAGQSSTLNTKGKLIMFGVPVIGLIVAVATLGVIAGIIVFVVALIALVLIVGRIAKTVEVLKGHNRCKFCKARMKRADGSYATTCRKCGKVQPWAAAVTA